MIAAAETMERSVLEADFPRSKVSKQRTARARRSSLPFVTLPGESATITDTGDLLGELLAETGRFYIRGGLPVRASTIDSEIRLEVVRSSAACSDFEMVARLRKSLSSGKLVNAVCPEQAAKQILASQAFLSRLLGITVLSRCAVLTERHDSLITITGYDRESGIWATGKAPPDLPLNEAIQLLDMLLADFHFASPGDRSRALAALITPSLVFGGLLGGRSPIDVGEADLSQSGKGYRNKLTAAIYRNVPRTITQRDGGVGGLQETFDAVLASGACFPALDNLRGKVSIPAIESFMTEDAYMARIPYSTPMEIDATRTVLMLTANKADLTPDMANRSSVVRILKQSDDFEYQRFPEGDLLSHVKANHELFLGAVFTVIREWHRLGKQQLNNAPHDFKPWACRLGWIVENVLKAAPLVADHREIQVRMASSAGNWLRDLALAVKSAGRLGEWLRAHHILDIVIEKGVPTPGIDAEIDTEDNSQFQNATRAIGRLLGQGIKAEESIVDGVIRIERRTGHDAGGREKKEHRFTVAESQETQCSLISPNAPPIGNHCSRMSPITSNTFQCGDFY